MKLTRNRLYSLQLMSGLAGLAISIFLLAQHTRVKNGIQGSPSFCSFGRYADCDVVNSSGFSELFGFPLASIGAIFYGLLLALSILSPPNHVSFGRVQRYFGWLALAGIVTDIALAGIQLFALRNFCLLCFMTYAATFGALFTAAKLTDSSAPNWLGKLGYLITNNRKRALPPLGNFLAAAVAFTGITAAILLLPAQLLTSSATHQKIESSIEKFVEEFRDKRKRLIDVKSGDATLGNSASRVRIIAFSDFECPHCQHAAFTLRTSVKPYQDRVFFAFKHFPLDSSCNRLVTFRMHENACALARIGYCANRRGKFWEFHDTAFTRAAEGDHPSLTQFKQSLKGLMTEKEMDQCLKDPASLNNVQADIQLGDSLDVKGTPSVFINGKLVTIPLTVEIVQRLIEIELAL